MTRIQEEWNTPAEEPPEDENRAIRPPLTLDRLRRSLRQALEVRTETLLSLFLLAPEVDLNFGIEIVDNGATIAENEPGSDVEQWQVRHATIEEVLAVLEAIPDAADEQAILRRGLLYAADLAMDAVGRTRSPQGASTARNIARVLRDAAGADVREETLRGIRPADDAELAEAVATGVEQGRMIALRTLEEQEAALRSGLWTPDQKAAADALQAAGAALREAVNPYLRPVENETEARLRASLISALTLLARIGIPEAHRRERALEAVQQRVLACFRSESSVTS